MKILKKLIVTFLTAVLTVMMIYGGYTIYAATEYTFQKQKTVKVARAFYRKEMNDLFAKKLDAFLDLYETKGTSAFSNSRMKPPEIDDPPKSGSADCDKAADGVVDGNYDKACVLADKCRKATDNLSTFCVSVEALDIFIAYRGTLEAIRSNIYIPLSVQTGLAPTDVLTGGLASVNRIYTNQQEAIATEIDNSRKELDAVVSLYDQFVFNWPIHVKLNETKKELITYKNKLKKIRQKLERFPGKFVDATSTKCE